MPACGCRIDSDSFSLGVMVKAVAPHRLARNYLTAIDENNHVSQSLELEIISDGAVELVDDELDELGKSRDEDIWKLWWWLSGWVLLPIGGGGSVEAVRHHLRLEAVVAHCHCQVSGVAVSSSGKKKQ
ncbi:hypothetical protein EDC04DRAFT_2599726 [Pisolithus marmoratus]|nr:hypothetical protein EDC04DRAFT_2599726 [Pisolithus marmoratus]